MRVKSLQVYEMNQAPSSDEEGALSTPNPKVLSLPHRFQSEPVGTDQIPIGNFQVEYLPNKQRTPPLFLTGF